MLEETRPDDYVVDFHQTCVMAVPVGDSSFMFSIYHKGANDEAIACFHCFLSEERILLCLSEVQNWHRGILPEGICITFFCILLRIIQMDT